ncbi:MAG: hypothetical protein ACYSW0_10665, partial [Planctomycetota bacterium]
TLAQKYTGKKMALERLVNRIIQCFSWLYYRRWEAWELLAIAIVGTFVLMFAIRVQDRRRRA